MKKFRKWVRSDEASATSLAASFYWNAALDELSNPPNAARPEIEIRKRELLTRVGEIGSSTTCLARGPLTQLDGRNVVEIADEDYKDM